MNRKFVLGFSITACSFLVTLGVMLFLIKTELISQGSIGVDAVNYLYNYKTIEQLAKQDESLKEIVTDDVYKYLTVTNYDKSLNVYLKFKQCEVEVEILSSSPGKVVYTLHTDALSDGRKFIFLYDVNWFGKICNVQEFEGIPFY